MAHQGEAASYYNDQSGYQQDQQPQQPGCQQYQQPQQQQQQQQYGMQNYNNSQKYPQGPPTYDQNFHPPQDNKQDFQQTFKVDKPKFNDLWAGILVRRHSI